MFVVEHNEQKANDNLNACSLCRYESVITMMFQFDINNEYFPAAPIRKFIVNVNLKRLKLIQFFVFYRSYNNNPIQNIIFGNSKTST